MSEILIEGTTALIAGMGSVFIVLILISFVIGSLEYIDPLNRERKFAEMRAKRARKKGINISDTNTQPMNQVQSADLEEQARVVAAISITLATALNTNIDRLQVKSIRRI